MTREIAQIAVNNAIDAGRNVIIFGKGGSGKTTLLDQAINSLSPRKHGIGVQENNELRSINTNVQYLTAYLLNTDIPNILSSDMFKRAYDKSDYFVDGEMRGKEDITQCLQAAKDGKQFFATIYERGSEEDAISRMADYMHSENDSRSKEEYIAEIKTANPVMVSLN